MTLDSAVLTLKLLESMLDANTDAQLLQRIKQASKLRESLDNQRTPELEKQFVGAVSKAYYDSRREKVGSSASIRSPSTATSDSGDEASVEGLQKTLHKVLVAGEKMWMFFDPRYVVVDSVVKERSECIQVAKTKFLFLLHIRDSNVDSKRYYGAFHDAKKAILTAEKSLHNHISEVVATWEGYMNDEYRKGQITGGDVLDMARAVCNHVDNLELRAALLVTMRNCFGFAGEGEVNFDVLQKAIKPGNLLLSLSRFKDAIMSLLRDLESVSSTTYSLTDPQGEPRVFARAWEELRRCFRSLCYAQMVACSLAACADEDTSRNEQQLTRSLELLEEQYSLASRTLQACLDKYHRDSEGRAHRDNALKDEANFEGRLDRLEKAAKDMLGRLASTKPQSSSPPDFHASQDELLEELRGKCEELQQLVYWLKKLLEAARKEYSKDDPKWKEGEVIPLEENKNNGLIGCLDPDELQRVRDNLLDAELAWWDLRNLWKDAADGGLIRDDKAGNAANTSGARGGPRDFMRPQGIYTSTRPHNSDFPATETSLGHKSNPFALTDAFGCGRFTYRPPLQHLLDFPLSLKQALLLNCFEGPVTGILQAQSRTTIKRLRRLIRKYRTILHFTKQIHKLARNVTRQKRLVKALKRSNAALIKAERSFPPLISAHTVSRSTVEAIIYFSDIVRHAQMEIANLLLVYEAIVCRSSPRSRKPKESPRTFNLKSQSSMPPIGEYGHSTGTATTIPHPPHFPSSPSPSIANSWNSRSTSKDSPHSVNSNAPRALKYGHSSDK